MQTDLFRSSKQKLYDEIKLRGVMKTSDVLKWGCKNFSNRCDRNMRQLAKEGLVRRMDEKEKIIAYGNILEDVWTLT